MTASTVKREEKKKLAKVPKRWVAEHIEEEAILRVGWSLVQKRNNILMSGKGQQQHQQQVEFHEEVNVPPVAPAVESNFEARNKLNDLQAEQFMACPQSNANNISVSTGKKCDNVRDATMLHYNSLNAIDYI